MCIGAAFASMEATLVLATLAGRWHADVPDGFDPGTRPSVTLRTRLGLPAVLHPLT
jgi:cytochrome P450